jgi:hypothetical protein
MKLQELILFFKCKAQFNYWFRTSKSKIIFYPNIVLNFQISLLESTNKLSHKRICCRPMAQIISSNLSLFCNFFKYCISVGNIQHLNLFDPWIDTFCMMKCITAFFLQFLSFPYSIKFGSLRTEKISAKYANFIIQQLSDKFTELLFLNLENVNIFQCFYIPVSTSLPTTNKL